MSAKSDLFARLEYLNAAVNLPALIDNGIAINEHNGVANLLRKGLGIVAFNILEDYIKNRSEEALNALSNSIIPFSTLTEALQEAAIAGALTALSSKINIIKKDNSDWKTIVQEETLKIHSTRNSPYVLSRFSFMNNGSNIGSNDVNEFLAALGMKGGWATMKSVSDDIGGGIPDLSQIYKNTSQRRHNAAHVANFQYNFLWLSNIKNEILAIAAALDILICARCRQVISNPAKKMDLHKITDALKFRFLELTIEGEFRETTKIGGRSRKNWATLNEAINHLQPLLIFKNEFLIILNSHRRIENWFS